MFLEWDEKYSVGVQRLDDQHKILFSIINDISEAIEGGGGNLSLGDVLDSMVSYTKVHFFSEEKYMRDYGYPDFNEHRKEHQYFVGRVESFKKELEGGPWELAEDVLEFLRKWLTAHISVKDMKYRVFFNKKGLI